VQIYVIPRIQNALNRLANAACRTGAQPGPTAPADTIACIQDVHPRYPASGERPILAHRLVTIDKIRYDADSISSKFLSTFRNNFRSTPATPFFYSMGDRGYLVFEGK